LLIASNPLFHERDLCFQVILGVLPLEACSGSIV
jgi:hypothetical protein